MVNLKHSLQALVILLVSGFLSVVETKRKQKEANNATALLHHAVTVIILRPHTSKQKIKDNMQEGYGLKRERTRNGRFVQFFILPVWFQGIYILECCTWFNQRFWWMYLLFPVEIKYRINTMVSSP